MQSYSGRRIYGKEANDGNGHDGGSAGAQLVEQAIDRFTTLVLGSFGRTGGGRRRGRRPGPRSRRSLFQRLADFLGAGEEASGRLAGPGGVESLECHRGMLGCEPGERAEAPLTLGKA